MPPKLPLLLGRTIIAREEDWSGTTMLEIRARAGHAFTSPRGTHALYVPRQRIVEARGREDAVEFIGEFSRTGYPPRVVLEPVDPQDARKLCAMVTQRYGLPRLPRDVDPASIRHCPGGAFVSVVAEVRPAHCESANFAGLWVRSDDERIRTPGQRLRVTGFYELGWSGEGVPPVGYGGPRLSAVTIEGPRHTSVALDALGGRVDAWIGSGHARWLAARTPAQRMVGLLAGCSGPVSDAWVSHAHVRALRSILEGSSTEGALPQDAAPLLEALERRLEVVLAEEGRDPGLSVSEGVLACVEGRRVTVLHRGAARILRKDPRGIVTVEATEAELSTSRFGAWTPEPSGPRSFDLVPGEQLLLVTGAVVHERSEEELVAAVAEPTLSRTVDCVRTGRPITAERWGLLAIATAPMSG